MIKVLSAFGTRPEAIKMCPLIKEMERCSEIESVVCLTGQHREMLAQVMNAFQIEAKYNLDIMRDRQTLFTITSDILVGVEDVLEQEKPDVVLVHGDTTTSFSVALAAFYKQIDVGHIEAGLRTHDKYSPFPEEMNRTLLSRIAKYHFAPTMQNVKPLGRKYPCKHLYHGQHRNRRIQNHHHPAIPFQPGAWSLSFADKRIVS
ncbi:MAG: non-hydrolyzing UDP-N-acetylglucosamine 2-epimerase [Oscillospiraceae bacterium]